MKAIRVKELAAQRFDNVMVQDVEPPEPGRGQVRVRMLFSPINPSDHNFIRGTYADALRGLAWNQGQDTLTFDPERKVPIATPPYTLGAEGIGIVEGHGGGFMAKRLMGKRVAVASGPPDGTWQESAIVDARRALTLPDNVSDEQGSMFFVNPITAYAMVHKVLRVPRGAVLLQTGAASAVGQMVIALSKRAGFKTINLVRSEHGANAIRDLGGDFVIPTDAPDMKQQIISATGNRGIAYALDCIGGDQLGDLLPLMGVQGRMLLYGTLGGFSSTLKSRDMMMPMANVGGFLLPVWLGQQPIPTILRTLKRVKQLLGSGNFKTEIAEIYHLGDIRQALQHSVRPGKTGKVLLRIGDH